MADFRKWLLVLAAVAVFAASASAQTTCSAAQGAIPPSIRDGGLTELVGDVLVNCQNIPAGGLTTNLQVFLTAPVTNDFTVSTPGVIVTDQTGTASGAFKGVAAGSNSILFLGVALPEGTTAQIRVTNIRVVAPGASAVNGFPTRVQEYISTNNVSVSSPIVDVANVLKSFDFAVTDCAGATPAGFALSFQQCVAKPATNELHFGVKFTEQFPYAFKVKGDPLTQTNPTVVYSNAETGHNVTVGATTISDTAAYGTRFIVRFSNVPSDVTIRVSGQNLPVAGLPQVNTAMLVPDANANGIGGTPLADLSAGTAATCSASGANTRVFEAKKDASGVPYAVWEVTASDPNALDQILFGIQLKYTSVTAVPVAASQITGLLGPQYATAADAVAATNKYPGFSNVALATGTAPFGFVPCVTNLLFPYVTGLQDYTTGIALVNTSKDNAAGTDETPSPFNTTTQHGACHLYFFGNKTIAPQTTPDVPAGGLVKFTLNEPLAGWPSLSEFEGYIIARCDFQFAHGFAFIVDGNLPGFGSEAYLALVIPDRGAAGRLADPNFTAPGNSGEQLTF